MTQEQTKTLKEFFKTNYWEVIQQLEKEERYKVLDQLANYANLSSDADRAIVEKNIVASNAVSKFFKILK
jgi:hypothetical protein